MLWNRRILLIGLAVYTAAPAGTPPVHSLAIGPGDPPVVYAGTACAGIFKSTDGGINWRAINQGVTRMRVNVVAIDPAAPLTVLAATGARFADRKTPPFMLLRSSDGGEHWTETPLMDSRKRVLTQDIDAIVFDSVVPGTIHIATGIDYWTSVDQGRTWTAPSIGVTGVRALALDVGHPPSLFAIGGGGHFGVWDLFRGSPAGNWKQLYSDLPVPAGLLLADSRIPATLYAANVGWDILAPRGQEHIRPAPRELFGIDKFVGGRKIGGLFKSVDGGVNWTVLSAGLPPSGISGLAIHPGNSNILYASAPAGVFKSTDAGSTWLPAGRGLVDVIALTIAIDPAHPETLFLGTDYGVFKSVDGAASWSPVNQGLADCVAR